jgi:hypothetical protein
MTFSHEYLKNVGRQTGEDPEQVRERIEAYHRLFSSDLGRWVLTDILASLGFFSTEVEGEGGQALQNWARGHLLYWTGIWHEQNKQPIVDAMLSVQMAQGDEQE